MRSTMKGPRLVAAFLLGLLLFNYPIARAVQPRGRGVRHPAPLRLHLSGVGAADRLARARHRAFAVGPTAKECHASELGDHSGFARVPGHAVRHCLLRRSPGGPGPLDHRQSVHLCAFARRLCDGLDVLRQRRSCRVRRRRLPADLHRTDDDDGAVVAGDAKDHPDQQGEPHHVAGRLRLVALRQERGAGRTRHRHRGDRRRALHRAAAESRVAQLRDPGPLSGGGHVRAARSGADPRRHRILDGARAGDVHHSVRHATPGRLRKARRPGGRHCVRVAGQAGRISRRRNLHHLGHLRRVRRHLRAGRCEREAGVAVRAAERCGREATRVGLR